MSESLVTREAPARGISRRVLHGPKYEQVSYGVHLPCGAASDLKARCAATQRVLPPEAMFTHYTGARLRGWQLPWLPDGLPMFASLPGGGTHLHRRGLYVARTDEAASEPELIGDVRVADAPAILAQLAKDLSLLDLVAVIDSALHLGDTTIKELEDSLRPHQRGGPMLRRALAYADDRAESWWETPLRLLHVWSGIDVEPQYRVYDDWGDQVARGDLRISGTRRLHEYDGAVHDERNVRKRDLDRDKVLSRIDWERYGYIARDIVRRPAQIIRDAEAAKGLPHRPSRLLRRPAQIIRDAEAAKGLPHRPSRLRRWYAEAARSTLHAAGRRRLVRRLARFARD